MTIQAFELAGSPASSENRTPTPQAPAAPNAIGTQDSPIIVGQKPQQIPVAAPAQPGQRRRIPWWEADWAKVARATRDLRVKQQVIRQDTGTRPAAVEAQDFTDVINVDFAQFGLQGPVHKIQLTTRPGEPLIPRYVAASSAGFPKPPLDVTMTAPEVTRNVDDGQQVSPGFVDQLGAPKRLTTYALPYFQ